jgi:hypothetical protein
MSRELKRFFWNGEHALALPNNEANNGAIRTGNPLQTRNDVEMKSPATQFAGFSLRKFRLERPSLLHSLYSLAR